MGSECVHTVCVRVTVRASVTWLHGHFLYHHVLASCACVQQCAIYMGIMGCYCVQTRCGLVVSRSVHAVCTSV